jgi:hypothetical protein
MYTRVDLNERSARLNTSLPMAPAPSATHRIDPANRLRCACIGIAGQPEPLMRKAFLLAFAICGLPLFALPESSTAAAAERSAAIIDQSTRAAGGLATAQAIAALDYHMHIDEATFEVDGVYVVDRKGRMRVDLYRDGKRVFTECHDGTRAWEMDGDGKATDASAGGTAALWHGTQYPGQILALAELPVRGHRIDASGHERIDGVDYAVLKLTMSDGFETYRYVNLHTLRIERSRDVRAPHPDIDPKKTLLDTAWSDFRSVDGVLRPFRETQTDLSTGKWNQTVTVQSIRKLPALADALFVKGSPPDPAL